MTSPEVIQIQTVTPLTFSSSLSDLELFAKNYRQAHRQIFKSILVSYRIGFIAVDAKTAKLNESTLDAKCDELNILNIASTSTLHKIAKLAIGDNTKAVSAMANVVKIAIALGISNEDCIAWIEREGGTDKVRRKYFSDGKLKKSPDRLTASTRTTSTANNMLPQGASPEKIQLGREMLKNTMIWEAEKQALKEKIPHVSMDTECAAIILCRPDGSFVIKAIVQDSEVTDAAYASYAREHSVAVISETNAPTIPDSRNASPVNSKAVRQIHDVFTDAVQELHFV